jgi:hypothetical protein
MPERHLRPVVPAAVADVRGPARAALGLDEIEAQELQLLSMAVGDHALPVEIRDRLTRLRRERDSMS